MAEQTKSTGPGRRRWIIGGALLVAVVVLLAGADRRKTDEKHKPPLSAHAGSIKANNSMSTSSSHTSTEGSLFFAKRIAVINLSEHRIASEAASALADALRNQPFTDTVDLFQGDHRPQEGGLLYDLYVSLDMPEFHSKGFLLTGRKVKAKIEVTLGDDFWNSRHGYSDNLSPPTINLHMEATLEHESVAHGVELPGNPYRQVAANISTQLCESVTKSLGELAAKFSGPGTMPEGLVPDYRPLPPLPLPKTELLNRVISGHGLMLNNYTVWTMETTEPQAELTALLSNLEAEGWQSDSPELNGEQSQFHFRAERADCVIEAFETRGYGPRTEGGRVRLVIRYSDRMTREQLRSILEQVVSVDPVPLDTWLAFSRLMSQEQNDRVLTKIADQTNLPPRAGMRVIRYLNRTGKKEEALERLQRIAVLGLLDDSVKQKDVEKLGQEITGSKDWKSTPPTVEQLERYGLRRAVKGESFEVQVGVDEPVALFSEREGKLFLSSVKVGRSSIPEGIFSITVSECRPSYGGRSSFFSTPHTTSRPWKAETSSSSGEISWHISAEEIGEEARFNLKIESSP